MLGAGRGLPEVADLALTEPTLHAVPLLVLSETHRVSGYLV